MADEMKMIPATRRSSNTGDIFSGDMPSFSDTVFGFLDENYPLSSGNSSDYSLEDTEWGDDDDAEDDSCVNTVEKKAFWVEQEKLLHGILSRTTSVESRVRNATKEAFQKLETTINCNCRGDVMGAGCKDCVRQGIYSHLCNSGFNCLIQKSKWKSCREIPSGEHTYLEVVDKSSPNKGEIRVVIELNLREEFEIARASQEYNQLVKRLPQVYVGKPERLKNLIKILCGAAKKCMKDRKMHLAPWRKHKYVHAKWLNTCTDFVIHLTTTMTTTKVLPMAAQFSNRAAKPRASMLTQSLIEKISGSHLQSIAVI